MTAPGARELLSSIAGLRAQGFEGFVPMGDLDLLDVPTTPGIYAVLRDGDDHPEVAENNVGGWFKKKDPTIPRELAAVRLLPGVQLLYLGKASLGTRATRGLRTRVEEFLRFGRGLPVGHWGGRLIWQLHQPERLLLAWKIIEDDDPTCQAGAGQDLSVKYILPDSDGA